MAWISGILCAGVVGALLWFALPAGPVLVEIIATRVGELTR